MRGIKILMILPSPHYFAGPQMGEMPLLSTLPNISQLDPQQSASLAEGVGISHLLSAGVEPSCGAAVMAAVAKKATEEVPVGYGLPAIPKRLHDKMLAWEYVDLAELPPARAVPKEPSLTMGNIWLVQSTDLARSQKRLIPEITTWVQCFAIYTSVVATKFPQRVPAMLGYMVDIIRTSRQFKWPSWVMYDANYRREAAASGQTDWSKIDPSLYARCFTGWARNTGWCDTCMTLDHDAADCPYNQGTDGSTVGIKRPRRLPGGQTPGPSRKATPRPTNTGDAVCIKYNKYGGDCMFGVRCHFKHICSICANEGLHMEHPKTRCPMGESATKTQSSEGPLHTSK